MTNSKLVLRHFATICALLICTTGVARPNEAKSNFESNCTACHGFGIAGAPKLGNTEDWAGRLEKGKQALYANAINGFEGEIGAMPPKGGVYQIIRQRNQSYR